MIEAKNVRINYTKRANKEKGITLVALIVTIIILVILAAIAINILYNSNMIKLSIEGTEGYTKAQQDESDEIEGIVDELKQGLELIEGKNRNDNIEIVVSKSATNNYITALVKADIKIQGEIDKVTINGEEAKFEDVTEKDATKSSMTIIDEEKEIRKYKVEKEVNKNGTYKIIVIDKEGKYNTKDIKVTEITEDMEIWNKEDMAKFREKVAEGRTFKEKTVKIMQNIDLEGNDANIWIPIATSKKQFLGEFDGGDYTIKGLYIKGTEEATGLFSYNSGTIQNINIENGNIESSYSNTGMLVRNK